jgi:sulfite reductase beta subunit-like hemoprotein
VRYFVRNEVCQLMPRKYKTAFTATDEDIAITGIHDGGFIPRIKDGRRGFEMRVGGGTSIMPRVAPTLYEFVGADDGEYLKVTEAVLRIFNRQEELRANRARARIKVLVDRIGMDAFRALVEEELRGDWVAERNFDPAPLLFVDDEQAGAPAAREAGVPAEEDRAQFERFVAANTRPQRQEGFVTVEVKVVRGDLTPEQFRGLAAIMREHSGGYARTTVQQNLVLRWVRPESLYAVWLGLRDIDLAGVGPRTIADLVSCPGTDSCKLGITSSMGLSAAIQERIDALAIEDPLTRSINIKMSGCPNGCGQHHIANIGFTGASIKLGTRTIPAYIPHLAGNFAGGTVAMGQRLKSRLPAKRVPEAVERWLAHYQRERVDGEEFNAFVDRIGTASFEQLVADLALPPDFALETMSQFIDWNRNEPFAVVRGEGECAV